MEPDVIEFLQQSNFIENVADSQSLDDAVEAWKYLSKKSSLNKGRILHTHAILMKHQHIAETDKGEFRKTQVWIGNKEARPWFAIPELMNNWIMNANDVVKNGKHEPTKFLEELIKGQHVIFEGIHPFIDGNGRMGRILLNWQRIKLGLPILVIREEDRRSYYEWFR